MFFTNTLYIQSNRYSGSGSFPKFKFSNEASSVAIALSIACNTELLISLCTSCSNRSNEN